MGVDEIMMYVCMYVCMYVVSLGQSFEQSAKPLLHYFAEPIALERLFILQKYISTVSTRLLATRFSTTGCRLGFA